MQPAPLPAGHAAAAHYTFLRCLGSGTYGDVHRGVRRATGGVVALKVMKQQQRNGNGNALAIPPEVRLLARAAHVNVIRLIEVVYDAGVLVLAFEHADENLLQFMQACGARVPDATVVRGFAAQLLYGVAHIHRAGVVHRDLKPENVLIINGIVKIADFGSAKLVGPGPHSAYVSTRWYRPPELVLRFTSYTTAVDVWAAGCVVAELATLRPLFPGASDVDMLARIFAALGGPSPTSWPRGSQVLLRAGIAPGAVPTIPTHPLAEHQLRTLNDPVMCGFLTAAVQLDPEARPGAAVLLGHPYFGGEGACHAP